MEKYLIGKGCSFYFVCFRIYYVSFSAVAVDFTAVDLYQ